jgi:hypothetical protein
MLGEIRQRDLFAHPQGPQLPSQLVCGEHALDGFGTVFLLH